jgi:DNA end-binding protein Ku
VARATWSGTISFGLVSVPVQLFTAVRSHTVRFKQLHGTTGAPIKQQRVDSETGDEVPYAEIVKGYEVDGGEYVVVDPDELRALDPDASRTIEILDFVDREEIDPVYYDRAYYLSPDGEASAKPYRLLVEAMARSNKVAIASFVMRGRSYLAAVRAREGLLVLSTMHYADEVADPAELEVDEVLGEIEVRDREVEMAEQLIASLERDFDPSAYRDEHRERLEAFLEAKASGQRIELPEPSETPGEVVDLVAALERSLERARGGARDTSGSGGSGVGPDYAGMTRSELYELAQERELPGRSQLTKAELVDALVAADEGGDADAGAA